MVLTRLPPSLADTLRYSDRFDYCLTPDELWLWQIKSSFSRSHIKRLYPAHCFLPGRSALVSLRQSRESYSRSKWLIARQVSAGLSRFPTIAAIFVTGSLAMNNCPLDDDIDLMIVTYPHTLWLTRILVVFYLELFGLRRPSHLPEHSSPRVADKICDNLYLDLDHLVLSPGPDSARRLYLSHELLQAKCVFDRFQVHHRLLKSNPWVKAYLPVAYNYYLSRFSSSFLPAGSHLWLLRLFAWLFRPLNFVCFVVQYAYMHSRIGSEKIGLGYAFFHPRQFTSPLDKP